MVCKCAYVWTYVQLLYHIRVSERERGGKRETGHWSVNCVRKFLFLHLLQSLQSHTHTRTDYCATRWTMFNEFFFSNHLIQSPLFYLCTIHFHVSYSQIRLWQLALLTFLSILLRFHWKHDSIMWFSALSDKLKHFLRFQMYPYTSKIRLLCDLDEEITWPYPWIFNMSSIIPGVLGTFSKVSKVKNNSRNNPLHPSVSYSLL